MTLQLVITIGYALSGVFPLIALLRRVRINARQNRELDRKVAERGHAEATWSDFDEKNGGDIRADARAERRDITWEVLLVGIGGVTLASITSIVAVWTL